MKLLRGKNVDKEIIKMMNAYLKLYNTGNPKGWEDYGGRFSCRMCMLTWEETNRMDCTRCPLGLSNYESRTMDCPCVTGDDDSYNELFDMLYTSMNHDVEVDKEIVRNRMKFLYKRLKANGYFD